jgi:hypothetical protein
MFCPSSPPLSLDGCNLRSFYTNFEGPKGKFLKYASSPNILAIIKCVLYFFNIDYVPLNVVQMPFDTTEYDAILKKLDYTYHNLSNYEASGINALLKNVNYSLPCNCITYHYDYDRDQYLKDQEYIEQFEKDRQEEELIKMLDDTNLNEWPCIEK